MHTQKSSSRKVSLAAAIIASVCIIIYVFALVQAAVRIYLSVDQRRFTAESEFYEIADLASSAGILGFMDEPFIETIDDALASSNTLEALIISGPDGEYAFERREGRAINWVNNTPRFINRFDLSRHSLYTPLRIQGLRNVNIQAVAGTFDYARLSGILKETLLIILAGLVLAFFTLLLEMLLTKSGGKQRYSSPSAVTEGYGQGQPSIKEPPEPLKSPAPVEAPREQPQERSSQASPQASSQKQEEEKPAPKGLYSPRSKIGWEEYACYRLESELHRCASSEQDLALIVMEFRNAVDDALFRSFAAEAEAFFMSKDLLFEKGKQGITVINPEIDLAAGIANSWEFHNIVMGKFPGVVKSKSDFCVGLSSRSGRLVTAERLMFEAGEALQRAKTDPDCPIIAFKSDPDKYRAFIASQNQRQS